MKRVISLFVAAILICATCTTFLTATAVEDTTPDVNETQPKSFNSHPAEVRDAVHIFMHLAKIHELPVESYDLNENGRIDVGDAVKIFMGLARMIERPSIDFEWGEKVYSTLTIDDNILGGKVLIILDKSVYIDTRKKVDGISVVNYGYDIEIIVEEWSDLTKVNQLFKFRVPTKHPFNGGGYDRAGATVVLPGHDKDNWEKLIDPNYQQNTIDAAAILQELDGIRCAEPNTYRTIGLDY